MTNWLSEGGQGQAAAGYRNMLDMTRSAVNPSRMPQAEYPDGYLGSVNSRRGDRLLKDVQSRLTQRSYQRGVHKGERIDPVDYRWRDGVSPTAGLEAQARGERFTQAGTPEEQINHMGKNHLLPPAEYAKVVERVGLPNPDRGMTPMRQAAVARLRPTWK
jgi:hypothetical protein